MNNPPLVTRMNELILPPPFPIRGRLVRPLPVHPADEAGQRHPEQQRDKDDGADDVVLEKFEDGGEGDVLEDVDDANDVVGVGLLALTQVAETLHLEVGFTILSPKNSPKQCCGSVKILVRIRISDLWIRIRVLLFSSLTFKTPTKNYFSVFLRITF
jgi:hypothetical protein